MWRNDRLIGFLVISASLMGCAQQASMSSYVGDSTENTEDATNSNSSSSVSLAANNVITKYCSDCHTNYHSAWKNFKTSKDWQRLGLVVAGKPDQSPLLIRTKFGYSKTQANMPSDTFLFSQFTKAEFEALRKWIVEMAPVDLQPPIVVSSRPSEVLSPGTAMTTVAVTTNESAVCRYSLNPGSSFEEMTQSFQSDGLGTNHQSIISGLSDGSSYVYYARCKDKEGNISLTDSMISFSVGRDNIAPTISNLQPSGTLAFGTSQATLRVSTNESSACRFSTIAGQAYSVMTLNLNSSDGLSHSAILNNLTSDRSYSYYVRCQDQSQNASAESILSFSINGDTVGPIVSNLLPVGNLAIGTIQTVLSLQTSVASTCRYSTTAGVAYNSMTSSFTAAAGGTSHSLPVANLMGGRSYSYYIRCRNASAVDSTEAVISFSVLADVSSPVFSSLLPQGQLSGGATSTTLSVTTNEASRCRYSMNPSIAYASMTLNLTADSNRFVHTLALTNLARGQTFNYYVRCIDDSGNSNTADSRITFSTEAVRAVSQILQTSCLGCHDQWSNYSDADYQKFSLVVAGNPTSSSFIRRLRYSGGVANMPAPVGGSLYQAFTQNDYNTLVAWVQNMQALPSDTVPPVLSNGRPGGILSLGTTSTTLSLSTNEASDCRYSSSPNVEFSAMTSNLTGDSTKRNHSATLNGLRDGINYFYFVRCRDTAGNAGMNDFGIAFSILSNVDTAPPIVLDPQPTGALSAGTTQATMSVSTNEGATCRYATVAGTPFLSMNRTLTATNGGMNHAVLLSGLSDGQSYNYFVKCIDGGGNSNTSDARVTFSVRTTTGNLFQSSQESIRIGDRNYVKSYLDAIFGSEGESVTQALIYNAISKFGGPCDPQLEPAAKCSGADINDLDAPVLPTTSTPREGQRMKACHVLSFNDTTLENALRAGLGISDLSYLSTNPIPSASEVQKIYGIFYPGRGQAADSVVQALIALANGARQAGRPLDPWRYIVLTLCYAPDWQMP